MGWSKIAPTLPEGSAWGTQKGMRTVGNHVTTLYYVSLARGEGNTFYAKMEATQSAGEYGDYLPANISVTCTVSGGASGSTTYSGSSGTQYFYYTGTAEDNIAISFNVSCVTSDSCKFLSVTSSNTWTQTAPVLPSGVSYSSEKQITYLKQNWYRYTNYASVARLDNKTVVIRIRSDRDYGEDGATYYPPSQFNTGVNINDQGMDSTTWAYGTSMGNVYYYYICTCAPTDKVVVYAGNKSITLTNGSGSGFEYIPILISFKAEGGTTPTSISRLPGATFGVLPTSKRDGYRLLGWTRLNSETIVQSTDIITEIEDFNLYASWFMRPQNDVFWGHTNARLYTGSL